MLNNEKRTPFHISKYIFCTVIFVAEYLFYPLTHHLLLRAVLKQIKRSVSPFLFKWIHRELCDAWQRTLGK